MKMQDNSKHSVAAMAAGLTILCTFAVQAAGPTRTPADSPVLKDRNETPEQHDARMAWWREAKFGMFIHWGLFSQLGGEWKGKMSGGGYAEWIMYNEKISIADYAAVARDFNPVKYDAEKWVMAAKNAGMKYMVITDSLKGPITAPPSPDGTQHTAHLRGAGSCFSQTINFDAGSYTVSFDAVKRAGYGAKPAPLTVSVDGAVILDLAPDKLGKEWASFTSPAFPLTAGSHTLTFTLGKADGDVMDLIDNVAIKYCK